MKSTRTESLKSSKLDDALLTAGEHGGKVVVVDVPTKVSYSLLEK